MAGRGRHARLRIQLLRDVSGRNGSFPICHDSLLPIFLILCRIDLENVITSLEPKLVGHQHETACVGVELVGGLLDGWEAVVKPVQGLVAE